MAVFRSSESPPDGSFRNLDLPLLALTNSAHQACDVSSTHTEWTRQNDPTTAALASASHTFVVRATARAAAARFRRSSGDGRSASRIMGCHLTECKTVLQLRHGKRVVISSYPG